MAEEARVFFLRKRRERAEDTERRALLEGLGPVSYTHLDVYKRQGAERSGPAPRCPPRRPAGRPRRWGRRPAGRGRAPEPGKLSLIHISTLVLDGDGCDSGNVNDGQMVTRLQAFLELLEGCR